MTEAAQRTKRAPRRRRRRPAGIDSSLLPAAIVEHYGAQIDEVAPEVLLTAWSWYERGRQESREAAAAEVERERLRYQEAALKWIEAVPAAAQGKPPKVNGTPSRPAWTPAQPKLPPGQGEPMRPEDQGATGDIGAEVDSFVAQDSGEAPTEGSEGVPAKYLPIGHYTSDVVAPIVDMAESMAKTPSFGVQVARDLLSKSEATCRNPPSGIIGMIDAALVKRDQRVGQDWSKMKEV